MSRSSFIFREGWLAWRRSGLAGGLATLTLAILAAFVLVFWGIHQSASLVQEDLLSGFEVEAFLEPGRERALEEVGERLAQRDGVAGVELVTKERAAKKFAERHGEELTSLLEANPLPASVIVKYKPGAISAERLGMEASEILADPDVEDVAYAGELLARFEQASDRVMLFAAVIALGILLLAVLLTMQAIRVAAKTGESWARAVFLVGGTRSQVRGPLALGGMLTGLVAGVIGGGSVTIALLMLAGNPWIASPDLVVVAVAVLLPVLIGWLGASRALTRVH